MGLDQRIGPRFLAAGVGYGGSCFPKDVRALEHMATQAGAEPRLLRAVMDTNANMRRARHQQAARAAGQSSTAAPSASSGWRSRQTLTTCASHPRLKSPGRC